MESSSPKDRFQASTTFPAADPAKKDTGGEGSANNQLMEVGVPMKMSLEPNAHRVF